MNWSADQMVEVGKEYHLNENEVRGAIHCLGRQTVADCLLLNAEHRPQSIVGRSAIRHRLLHQKATHEKRVWREGLACAWLNPLWLGGANKRVDALLVIDGPNKEGALLSKELIAPYAIDKKTSRLQFPGDHKENRDQDSELSQLASWLKLTVGEIKKMAAYAIRHYLDLVDNEELIVLSALPEAPDGRPIVTTLDGPTKRRLVHHKIGFVPQFNRGGTTADLALQDQHG